MELTWKYASFEELSLLELYAILQLRNKVFVVEQNCVYQDTDNKDELSFHLSGWNDKIIVAYCRILPPGLSYPEASIGRVVISPDYRNAGAGRALMKLAIAKSQEQFDCKKITLSAQLYLEKFYESLGFIQVGNTYLEDAIPHVKMQINF